MSNKVQANFIDRLDAFISSEAAIKRIAAREVLRGYDAGKLDRRTDAWNPAPETGDTQSWDHVVRLRARGWDMYRNNPIVRKILNATVSQVIGRGMVPEPLALLDSGEPDEVFRKQASTLWNDLQPQLSGYGHIGAGGLHGLEMAKLALRETILSGECLVQFVPLTKREQNRRRSPIPLAINLVAAERMVEYDWYAPIEELEPGNFVFRGIEFRPDGSRAAYWLYDVPPADPRWWTNKFKAKRYPAEDFLHLYVQDRIGQMRGVPWLGPVMLQIRDLLDLQQNELLASALRSCVAMAIKSINPAAPFSTASLNTSTQDAAGNTRSRLQPGSLIRLNANEELTGNAAGGPNVNVPDFASFMMRSVATGIPGIKTSTITGDYRQSSFSSERSAENDTWREVEQVQDWFANHFYQPVYDQVIDTAIMSGSVPMPADYLINEYNYCKANWSAPVRKDINPSNEVEADVSKVQNGLESFQSVVAARGKNWRDVLTGMAEVYEFAQQLNLPEELVDKLYGIPLAPEPDADMESEQGDDEENLPANAEDTPNAAS